ncbi:hypothetical protein HELRODRAFT_78636 [Helobdella robusta]|uniref:Translocating chain-associated membrane protein n=1 Tax=Helobdella robusta TaxID=6412 RepID=T1G3D9_HELRO|nr:hypothetical protein HELRODRAFT_78636 [Helobdella robusta]ESO04583.1 hypothetical protein HELRODRAFT_78636 [Helobdella robusta]
MVPPIARGKKNAKNPPIFSHEFIIQNHGDIVSCLAMIAVSGLFFESSSPLAIVFIALQHNVTLNVDKIPPLLPPHSLTYTNGLKDIFTIFFYTLICIVAHAVIQEYILDKLNRRMHLSKLKHSKFNESGQLLVFYAASAVTGYYILIKEDYLSRISGLWDAYPHLYMSFWVKLYFILQISHWVHCYPELYFQKVKKEEIVQRLQYYTIYLTFITVCYILNLSLLGLLLLTIHYTAEFLFHLSRLLYFAEKESLANSGFKVWNVAFVVTRLATITLSILTLWYGLSKTSVHVVDWSTGNFNTFFIRVNCLVALFLLQAYIMWNFITFHLRRFREKKDISPQSQSAGTASGKKQAPSSSSSSSPVPGSGKKQKKKGCCCCC